MSIEQRKQELSELWYNLYLDGYPIGEERLQKLVWLGIVPRNMRRAANGASRLNNVVNKRDFNFRKGFEVDADAHIEIHEEVPFVELRDDISNDIGIAVEELEEDVIFTMEDELRSKIKGYSYFGKNGIKTSDWKLSKDEVLNYDFEFWNWINSINSGFQNKIRYNRFELYRQQAYDWLSDASHSFDPMDDLETQLKFLALEKERCLTNSVYALNRNLKLKEGEIESGGLKYSAWECQEVALFLFDNYLCYMLGKLRQVGLTSTLGGASILRTALRKGYFTKFITEKGSKGFEIFDDKVKYGFNEFPSYLKPTVNNDSKELFRFIRKDAKGSYGGADSKFLVETPYPTAINGGTPNLVLIDEIGTVPFLSEIIDNGRPTLFWVNPNTGRIELKRQCIAWGTGGKMDKGGGAMYREYKALKEKWLDKDFTSVFIPVFLNWAAKPGLSKEFVEQQRTYYYSKGDEDSKIIFHQTYPETEEDMFLLSSQTIIPIAQINNRLQRSMSAMSTQKFGYFVPVFDFNTKLDEGSDVPYKITGAQFQQTSGFEDPLTCATIIHEPEDWEFRYYQGTDPIFSVSGHSKIASSIWDAEENTVSSVVNFRSSDEDDFRYCYLQVLLQGIYYDKEIKNNVEANVGQYFIDYVKFHGFKSTLAKNSKLAKIFHLTTLVYGFKKTSGGVQRALINKLEELIHLYGDNINVYEFWYQLKTFVRKRMESGDEKYGANNKKIDYDDVIDSVIHAYMLATAYAGYEPRPRRAKSSATNFQRGYSMDGNYNLRLQPQRRMNGRGA